MSLPVAPRELDSAQGNLHAENASCPNLPLDIRSCDADASCGSLQTAAESGLTERWTSIPGFPHQEVSDLGNLRTWLPGRGARASSPRGRPLLSAPRRLAPSKAHRPLAGLWDGEKVVYRPLSAVVLLAWCGPRPEGFEACHFPDHDPRSCRLDTLRWDSAGENGKDRAAHGSGSTALMESRLQQLRERFPHLRSTAAGARFIGGRKSHYDPYDAMLEKVIAARTAKSAERSAPTSHATAPGGVRPASPEFAPSTPEGACARAPGAAL